MNNHYSRKNMYSLGLAADRILKSLSCPIFKTHFLHKTTESAGRCYPPWSEQKDEHCSFGLFQLMHPSTFNFLAVPFAPQCQHNCLGSRLAAWHTGWSRAACTLQVQPRRQGGELLSVTTLKCWQKTIFIPAPEHLHPRPQSNTVPSWVS